MNEHQARANLPRAYALSLWLRDLGCNEEQIASVLSIETEAVRPLLKLAALKVRRLRAAQTSATDPTPGIAVFVCGCDEHIDAAAAIAKRSGGPLHLLACYNATKRVVFGGSERALQRGGGLARQADAALLYAARRAVTWGVDVVPHAIPGDPRKALSIVQETWGPLTVVVGANDPIRRAVERVAARTDARVVVVDASGQVTRDRAMLRRALVETRGLRHQVSSP